MAQLGRGMDSGISLDRLRRSVLIETISIPNYARLLAGQVIAAFGDRINQTALLAIVVYVSTGNTAKYSADIIFFGVLPYVALGPFAMSLVDRMDRRRTMVGADLARALLAAVFPLVFYWVPHHYIVYILVFLMGACGAVFTPCRMALMPSLVPTGRLLPANAIASQAGVVATLATMPIAGWIVENLGRNSSFLINATTYLVSAVFLLRLVLPRRGEGVTRAPRPRPVRDLRLGLGYLGRHREVASSVLAFSLMQGLVAVFFVAFLSYGVDVLGQTVGGVNLLFGAIGLGMGAGAVWMGSRPAHFEGALWPLLMMVGAGAGMWVLSLVFNPWLAAPVLFAIGGCAVTVLTPMDTFLQRAVPDRFRGRVFAVRGILVGSAFLFSLQFSKAILRQLGTLTTFRTLAVASVVAGILFALIQRRAASLILSQKSDPMGGS
ncbi:MAG: MFS transporter [Verrucomicrobiia bacterium]